MVHSFFSFLAHPYVSGKDQLAFGEWHHSDKDSMKTRAIDRPRGRPTPANCFFICFAFRTRLSHMPTERN